MAGGKVFFLLQHHVLESQGAMLGLEAKKIAGGDFSSLFQGEPLHLSLKILFAAELFSLLGSSVKVLLFLPLFFYLGFVISTYWLVCLVGGRKAARIAMLLTLLAPYWINIMSVQIEGKMDLLFYGNLILIFLYKICFGVSTRLLKGLFVLLLLLVGIPLLSSGWNQSWYPLNHFFSIFTSSLPTTLIWNFQSHHIFSNLFWFFVFIPFLISLAWLFKENSWKSPRFLFVC